MPTSPACFMCSAPAGSTDDCPECQIHTVERASGRGGTRPGAGRPSAFPRGVPLDRRAIGLPAEVWARLDALADDAGTTPAGMIARMVGGAS
jgi:hypothetical protein